MAPKRVTKLSQNQNNNYIQNPLLSLAPSLSIFWPTCHIICSRITSYPIIATHRERVSYAQYIKQKHELNMSPIPK